MIINIPLPILHFSVAFYTIYHATFFFFFTAFSSVFRLMRYLVGFNLFILVFLLTFSLFVTMFGEILFWVCCYSIILIPFSLQLQRFSLFLQFRLKLHQVLIVTFSNINSFQWFTLNLSKKITKIPLVGSFPVFNWSLLFCRRCRSCFSP